MDTLDLPRNPETLRNPETHSRNGETPSPHTPPMGTLSLKELHEALGARGVVIGYSALSELIASGDVAALLGAGGTGGRRAFPPAALETLAGFLPGFQANGGRRPQAPVMLRSYLLHGGEAVPAAGTAEGRVTDIAETQKPDETQKPTGALASVLGSLAGLPAALRELTGFLRETRGMNETRQPPTPAAPPPADRLLSAEDAAALLACSPRSVSRYVAPVLPRKWRESDVLTYIAGLGKQEAAE